jgi:thiol:disulfide interchange protein DsbA
MRLFQKLLAVASLSLFTAIARRFAGCACQRHRLPHTRKTAANRCGKKVEVTEFFWYSCPHCNALEPSLEAWVKKQGDKITFRRVPVMFRESFIPQQKLYYTLEAMGLVDSMHAKVFRAIHIEHQQLDTDKQIADFIAKQGVDAKKFADVYNSFGVQTKVQRAHNCKACTRSTACRPLPSTAVT